MIPVCFILIILHAYVNKIAIYDSFVSGAKEGIITVFKIFPTLLGLMLSVAILRESGALNFISKIFLPLAKIIGYPCEAIPLTFMRLVSSSASTSLILDIFKNHGPDSFIGRFVSIMMSCTETIFYTISVYFMSVKITKIRYTLAGALISNFFGIISSLIITKIFFHY
ncbi:MAG: spore maturation protein [Clostridiales bacterium]|jgi:spore maturation protein B|nr:spore maturation protein [Clostridiales bacterium]